MAPFISWSSNKGGPPFAGVYSYLLAMFIGFAVADLTILRVRDSMLPSSAPIVDQAPSPRLAPPRRGTYGGIATRNIFDENGIIPPPLRPDQEDGESQPDPDGDPVPSNLPLTLVGTIVMVNSERSIATIELRGKNQVLPFSVGSNIDGIAELTGVRRQKAVFRNLNNGRLEFIEIADANRLSFNRSRTTEDTTDKTVQQEGRNRFSVQRSDLLKYTNNLGDVLQQARAVPNRDPRTGEVNGFRILDMKEGSIFEQLGLEKMDVIKGVDGEPVTSPAQAMQLYQSLKDSSQIRLQIERGGRDEEITYTVQ